MAIKTTEELLGKTEPTPSFRPDLRPPAIQVGKCAVTGELGKVVAVDLGDLAVTMPAHWLQDRDSRKYRKVPAETKTINAQVTLSQNGLRLLADWMDNQDNPIPAVKPDRCYQWQVLFRDGSALKELEYDGVGTIVENRFPEERVHEVVQFSYVDASMRGLPTYTFDTRTGEFWKNGEKIDLDFEERYLGDVPGCRLVQARQVHLLFGSSGYGANPLGRDIHVAYDNVLYVLGWKIGPYPETGVPSCLIAIDGQGNWRSYQMWSRLQILCSRYERTEDLVEKGRLLLEMRQVCEDVGLDPDEVLVDEN
jgi:hypothetical protein